MSHPIHNRHLPSTDLAVKSIAVAMDQPIEVDRVQIGDGGQLWPRTGTAPIHFTFADRGQTFLGRLVRVGERARLHLAAALGQMPYTVESADGRKRLLQAMRGSRLQMGRLSVGPHQTICLEGELIFDAPVTPDRLIAAATVFVAHTRATVDRVAEALPARKPVRAA